MKKIIAIALTLVFVPMLFSADKTTPVFSISGLSNNHIVPIEKVPHEMTFGRHLLDSLYYCNLAGGSAIGLSAGGTFEGAIRLTPTELGPYTGWDIIAIVFRHYESSLDNVVKVYDNGTPTSPGPMITSEPYVSDIPGWKWIDLSSPVTIPGTGDLWCSVEVTHPVGEYPLSVDGGPAVDGKGDWIGPNPWGELQDQGLDYNWLILAIVQLLLNDDVATISIDMPDLLPPDTTFNPQATVKNVGLDGATFDVTCEIEPGGYASTETVTGLAADDSAQVTFPDQLNFPLGSYTVTVYTQLAGDGNPSNDTLVKDIEVFWTDVMTVSIDIPDEVPTDTAFMPQASLTNNGTYTEGFLTSCRIEPGGYYKNVSVSDLSPGETLQVTFNQEFTFLSDIYTVTVYTRLSDDDDTSNDTLEKVIDATGIAEEGSDTPIAFTFTAPTISNGRTEIEFTLPTSTMIDLLIYDVMGRLSETLISDRLSAGTHSITTKFDLPTGVYFYNLRTQSGRNIIQKFLIVE